MKFLFVWRRIIEKLRRIDKLIANKLAEKQKIICSMFRVPDEDFNTIVDIASQPEAPQVRLIWRDKKNLVIL